MNLLPYPRFLKIKGGKFTLPARASLRLDKSLPRDVTRAIARRLQAFLPLSSIANGGEGWGEEVPGKRAIASISAKCNRTACSAPEAYTLTISVSGILIQYREQAGLRAAVATLRQLLREYGRTLPCLEIRDWPDFPRRGVMLDISRGRVPKLETLLELVEHLADFKINEFQLYTEHTFAYRKYKPIWKSWSALTRLEIRKLDARCRELGIDLVPNQNSFGHLREWLAYPPLKKLAEVSEPYEAPGGDFLRYPSTLAPNHLGTLPFLRSLYRELLPNFSSKRFNIGCDETWDLGRGQSKALCERFGKGTVYLNFLKQIHREVSRHGRQMMFWGDIILKYPGLIKKLSRNVIALNWGYEANHPFNREARKFAKSRIPFYVCPGTSTWMTLIGKHDNAFANLRLSAAAGCKHGAQGYLITDWGDGGHPQPLAVSYLPYLYGAAVGWCAASFKDYKLLSVLSRDVFGDPTGRLAWAALALGLAYKQLGFPEPNATPLGTVIAAPPSEKRELFCRNGLKHFRKIKPQNIRATLEEIDRQLAVLKKARPGTRSGKILQLELELAARMAAASCHFMLWQQAVAAGKKSAARSLAKAGIRELQQICRDFRRYWPKRNKGTTAKCSAFLKWRVGDYRKARNPKPSP